MECIENSLSTKLFGASINVLEDSVYKCSERTSRNFINISNNMFSVILDYLSASEILQCLRINKKFSTFTFIHKKCLICRLFNLIYMFKINNDQIFMQIGFNENLGHNIKKLNVTEDIIFKNLNFKNLNQLFVLVLSYYYTYVATEIHIFTELLINQEFRNILLKILFFRSVKHNKKNIKFVIEISNSENYVQEVINIFDKFPSETKLIQLNNMENLPFYEYEKWGNFLQFITKINHYENLLVIKFKIVCGHHDEIKILNSLSKFLIKSDIAKIDVECYNKKTFICIHSINTHIQIIYDNFLFDALMKPYILKFTQMPIEINIIKLNIPKSEIKYIAGKSRSFLIPMFFKDYLVTVTQGSENILVSLQNFNIFNSPKNFNEFSCDFFKFLAIEFLNDISLQDINKFTTALLLNSNLNKLSVYDILSLDKYLNKEFSFSKKQPVKSAKKFIGLLDDIRHNLNILTSSRGYITSKLIIIEIKNKIKTVKEMINKKLNN